MTPERFKHLAQTYGANLKRWPEAEQAEAEQLCQHSPVWTRALLDEAADLDEAFVVGDVLLVMFQGRAALLVDRRSTSHEVVAAAMSGAN